METLPISLPHYATSPWTFTVDGRTYRGEVSVAKEWQPEFVLPLADSGVDFRLVFLTATSGPEIAPADSRILWLAAFSGRPGGAVQGTRPLMAAEPGVAYGAAALLRENLCNEPRQAQFQQICREFLESFLYVAEAEIPQEHQELKLDRVSLLAQLLPGYLIDHPEVWPALTASFSWFRARYRALYVAHHRQQRQEAAEARAQLQAAREKVEALQRLDRIPQLGPQLGESAVRVWETALATLTVCLQPEGEEGFALDRPRCTQCGIALGSPSPLNLTPPILAGIDEALQRQLRRVSSEAVHRVLASTHRPRLDRFLDVLQASDVGSLVAVLDDDLAAFIRALLSEALDAAYIAKAFAPLQEKFGVMDAGQIPAAVDEFEQLLRQAAEEARRRQPDTKVVLRLE